MTDTSYHDRRLAQRMKNPEFRAGYEAARAELLRESRSVEATFSTTVNDPQLYEQLLAYTQPSVGLTITQSWSVDPNERRPTTWRGVLRQMWDIMKWEYRGAAGLPRPHDRELTLNVPVANFSVSMRGDDIYNRVVVEGGA